MRRSMKLSMGLVATCALVVTACGSDKATTPEAKKPTAADSASTPAAAGTTAAASSTTAATPATSATSADPASSPAASSSAATTGAATTLTMWDFGGGGQEKVIKEWEAAHPGVKVKTVISGFDEHHEKLLAGFVSGQVPDVAVVEVGYSSLFKANPKNFVDLGKSCKAKEREANYLPFRWAHGVSADGTVIGFPTDVGGLAVAYRTDLFKAAGLSTDPAEVTKLISTWPEFLAVGDKYKAATGKKFLDSSGLLFESLVKQGPEGFYAPDGKATYETSEHVQKAWKLANEAISRGLSANLAGFSPEWNAAMAKGDYAVQLAPAWMRTYIKTQAPTTKGKWNIAKFPEGGGNWGGAQLTIPAAAKHPELACDLISYLTAPEQEIKIFQEFGNFPSAPALYTNPAIVDFTDDFFSGAKAGQIYVESINSVKPQVEGVDQRTVLREFGLGLQRVETGKESADAAWKSSLKAIKLAIKG